MYRIVMVEDSPDEAKVLRTHLERFSRERGEQFRISWFTSALEFGEAGLACDLIFMDIDLPGIDGMEAATLLRSIDTVTPLIFVTNLAQYAVRGYEVSALDFMVKPVTYYDFALRMEKALRVIKRNANKNVVVSTRDRTCFIPYDDLLYIAVDNHELSYHTVDGGEPPTVRGSLGKVEQELSDGPFVRISNSFLVNMNHIRSFKGDEVRLDNGETLFFSRPNRRDAVARITAFFGGSL